MDARPVITVADEDGRRKILHLDDLADDGWSIITIKNILSDALILAEKSDGEQVVLDAKQPLPASYGWAKTIHK